MNPFDVESVLLAEHAQHGAMVHFPCFQARVLQGIAILEFSAWLDQLNSRKEGKRATRGISTFNENTSLVLQGRFADVGPRISGSVSRFIEKLKLNLGNLIKRGVWGCVAI
jgi:hypothetical protein